MIIPVVANEEAVAFWLRYPNDPERFKEEVRNGIVYEANGVDSPCLPPIPHSGYYWYETRACIAMQGVHYYRLWNNDLGYPPVG